MGVTSVSNNGVQTSQACKDYSAGQSGAFTNKDYSAGQPGVSDSGQNPFADNQTSVFKSMGTSDVSNSNGIGVTTPLQPSLQNNMFLGTA